MCLFSSALKLGLRRTHSSRSCHQRFSAGSVMCMYSAPIDAAVGFAQRLHDLAQRHLLGGREVGVRRAERRCPCRTRSGRRTPARARESSAAPGASADRGRPSANRGSGRPRSATGREPACARPPDRCCWPCCAKALALARWANDSTTGACATSRRVASRRSAGTCCSVVEIGAPVVGHGAGVVEVGLVQLFDVRGIAPEQVRVRPVLLHHLAHLSPRFPALSGLNNLPRPGFDRWAD